VSDSIFATIVMPMYFIVQEQDVEVAYHERVAGALKGKRAKAATTVPKKWAKMLVVRDSTGTTFCTVFQDLFTFQTVSGQFQRGIRIGEPHILYPNR